MLPIAERGVVGRGVLIDMYAAAPLKVVAGTGAPVDPIAIR